MSLSIVTAWLPGDSREPNPTVFCSTYSLTSRDPGKLINQSAPWQLPSRLELTWQQAQERLQREWKSSRHWAAEGREVIPAGITLL